MTFNRRLAIRRVFLIVGVLLALASSAAAQRTNVTGTITDPNGLKYTNADVTMQIVPAGGSPFLPGNPPTFFNGTISGIKTNLSGSFGPIALPDNNVVSPGGTQWQFTVCITPGIPPPGGIGSVCFTATPITITGASQDVSAQLSAPAPALSLIVGGGGAPAFSAITSGTNITAAMVVGTGASLGVSGTGTIGATSVPVGGIIGWSTCIQGTYATSNVICRGIFWGEMQDATQSHTALQAAFTQTLQWGAATGAGVSLFSLTDTTNNTGTGFLFEAIRSW